MAGVLSFSDWLGGPDNIQAESIFPSTQRTYAYNFNQDITGWTFALDYQTVVVNPVSYDRNGVANFTASQVIGYFPADSISPAGLVNPVNEAAGTVNITIPGGLYTGAIIPDARKNVPITIVTVAWTTTDSPTQTNSHRWAFIQCYEAGVVIGDPVDEVDYTAFVVA
jgi:hypothetical protein